MEETIIYIGRELGFESTALENAFQIMNVSSAEEAIEKNWLSEAAVCLIGADVTNPVKEVQKINSNDSYLAIIMLALPHQITRVKQAVQFAPFIGKNLLVVSLSPELDLAALCTGAALRTKQKRNFRRINFHAERDAPIKKITPEQLGTFLDNAPIGAVLLNDAGQVVNYNQQAKNFFPALSLAYADVSHLFKQEEAITFQAFIHDGHHPEMKKEFTTGQKQLEITSSEVYSEEGQKHYLLLLNDVTYQRTESKRIEAILEALPQMAWTTNPAGEVLYFTQGWYHYTGQKRDEAKGSGWLPVIYPDDIEKLSERWNSSLQSGKPFQQAARYKNINGKYRWHLARASAIKNGNQEITMWVGTCTDIHDQIVLTEELERKVKERTRLLEVSNSELEQFAHVSSHDLQEPLRKIRTFAELLKEGSYEILDDTSKRYIDKINSTAERMSNSLKALLHFTKMHKEEKFIVVDLEEIVAQVLVDLELLVTQKGAVVDIEPLPQVKAIPIQMHQLFYNLINNALKFSRKDNPPCIKITTRQVLDEELAHYPRLARFKEYYEIIVKDNGVGFDQSNAEKIFTIFQRLHKITEFEGTGIGLSLVKKVVNNHNGEVRAVSTPGQGAAFHVILPV